MILPFDILEGVDGTYDIERYSSCFSASPQSVNFNMQCYKEIGLSQRPAPLRLSYYFS